MRRSVRFVRITFIYGLLWEHENLNQQTHATLHEFFGYITAKVSKQLALTMREKKLVSASGEDIYLPDVDEGLHSAAYRKHIGRLNIPICFIAGRLTHFLPCCYILLGANPPLYLGKKRLLSKIA